MNVLFLEISQEREWAVASIGAAFIGAFLRRHGHESSLFRVELDMEIEEVAAHIERLNPGLIGVSLTSRQWLRGREIVGALREVCDVPVVAGGLHPTFAPERVLNAPGFDYVCTGEGEEPMLELIETLERKGRLPEEGIRNIRTQDGPVRELRVPFEPIDDLPFMARDHLDEKHGVAHIVTQRGCPFPCSYCAARSFSDLYDGGYKNYGRRRSTENVLAELQALRKSGPLNYVIFLDDTFTINHPWVEAFCQRYKEEIGIPFSLHARVETVNDRLLDNLAAAGCMHITYGVESGSERVRREIMKRYASNQLFIDVFRKTREVGIMATANYILGTPGETTDDIDMTLALHEELKPTDFGYFIFYPYEGTALFDTCKENGYLPDDFLELHAQHRRSLLRLPDLTPEQIDDYYQRFTDLRTRDRIAQQNVTLSKEHEEDVKAEMQASAAKG